MATGRPLAGRGTWSASSSSSHRPAHPSSLRHSTASWDGSGESEGNPPTETSALLADVLPREPAHPGPCTHGTFSPGPSSPIPSRTQSPVDGDSNGDRDSQQTLPVSHRFGLGRWAWSRMLVDKIRNGKMKVSRELAGEAGVDHNPFMYLAYYIPCLNWMGQYKWQYLRGDFIAALTMASVYLPMGLSLAENLAHIPPINGLYGFVFGPGLYALLGNCALMVAGPESAGALLVGSVVRTSVDRGVDDGDADMHARITGVVVAVIGATFLTAGLARLGFIENMLSRPFLRGFISAVGVVIVVDQLVPELGLYKLAEESGAGHGSTVEKLMFLAKNVKRVHMLTAVISAASFGCIIVFRAVKKRLASRFSAVDFVPDRFLVVALSAFLSWQLEWERHGVAILGSVQPASGGLFAFRWPFQPAHMTHIRDAMGTAFLLSLLGFFESSVAAKGLGQSSVIHSMDFSPNRELVAIGVSNLIGACFMSLPSFGGYARSKLSKSVGGQTPMASLLLSLISLLSIFFLLPYFYFIPKPVLCAMISAVAWTLVEEAPPDIFFFCRIHGWTELGLMGLIFFSTMFYSLTMGIAIGVGLSVLRVVHHATRSRIQILGRVPGTQRFDNAEENRHRLEFVEGCLIVKIPEPLTFANTGELRSRLRRLERYGSSVAHPALPRLRSETADRNVIFDIHGVTTLDAAGTQVLADIVGDYRQRGVRVFFSRAPEPSDQSAVWMLMRRAGIVELVGGERHFVSDVQDALKLTEQEEGAHLDTFEA